MTSVRTHLWIVDPLEPRVLLASGPFAPLAWMENPDNPLVRISLNVSAGGASSTGDVELFPGVAPRSVASFLDAVRNGKLDRTLYDFASQTPTPFVRLGLIAAPEGAGQDDRPLLHPSLDFIPDESARPNDGWTLAIAPPRPTRRQRALAHLQSAPESGT